MTPWLVMVTGEPGSGKTTLGHALATSLRVPFLCRDDVRGGLLATAGLWTGELGESAPRENAVDAFVALVEKAATLGVSAVIEFVVFSDRAEAFARIAAAARIVVVRTTCADPAGRAEARDRQHSLLTRPETLRALGYASIDDYLAPQRERMNGSIQTEFDLPTLTVATDDGYEPGLPSIVDWVISNTLASRSR